MDSIDCNPTNAVGSVGGSSAGGGAAGSGGSPAGGGSDSTQPPQSTAVNGAPIATGANGNIVTTAAGQPPPNNNPFGPEQGSNLPWSADIGVDLNGNIVNYMNELSENIYKFLPRNSSAFTSGRNPYKKVRVLNGNMSIERMIYLMFDKITSKTSGGRVTTRLYDSLYKNWWQQGLKSEIFLTGLRNGDSHSKIRSDAVEKYKEYMANGQATSAGHASGNSLDLYSKNIFDAMGEKNPHAMTSAQMLKTRYVQSLKMAVRKSGRTKVCTEQYPQHIHVENK